MERFEIDLLEFCWERLAAEGAAADALCAAADPGHACACMFAAYPAEEAAQAEAAARRLEVAAAAAEKLGRGRVRARPDGRIFKSGGLAAAGARLYFTRPPAEETDEPERWFDAASRCALLAGAMRAAGAGRAVRLLPETYIEIEDDGTLRLPLYFSKTTLTSDSVDYELLSNCPENLTGFFSAYRLAKGERGSGVRFEESSGGIAVSPERRDYLMEGAFARRYSEMLYSILRPLGNAVSPAPRSPAELNELVTAAVRPEKLSSAMEEEAKSPIEIAAPRLPAAPARRNAPRPAAGCSPADMEREEAGAGGPDREEPAYDFRTLDDMETDSLFYHSLLY